MKDATNDLGRDARSLVTRVRRRDGPSAADRARLRAKLDPIWAADRAAEPSATVEPERVAAAAGWAGGRGLQPWAAAVFLFSLGFLAPEPPRMAAATFAAATAAPTIAPASLPSLPPSDAMLPPVAAEPLAHAGSVHAPEDSPARPAQAREAPRATSGVRSAQAREAPRANARAAKGGRVQPNVQLGRRQPTAAPRTASTSTPDPEQATTRLEQVGPHDRSRERQAPSAPARHEPSAARVVLDRASGDVAPELADRNFAPQPIDDELAWLGAAQDALRKRQPTRALQLVQEHAFRYPRGALAPERTAVHALALCALSRKEAARAVLADLERRAPSSPLLDRVRRNCGL